MSDKAKNIISYIIPICGIVFMLIKDSSKEVKLVGAQATTLWGLYILLRVVYSLIPIYIPIFSTALYGAYLVFGIIGIIKACKEENLELPLIGKITKSVFGKVIEG